MGEYEWGRRRQLVEPTQLNGPSDWRDSPTRGSARLWEQRGGLRLSGGIKNQLTLTSEEDPGVPG